MTLQSPSPPSRNPLDSQVTRGNLTALNLPELCTGHNDVKKERGLTPGQPLGLDSGQPLICWHCRYTDIFSPRTCTQFTLVTGQEPELIIIIAMPHSACSPRLVFFCCRLRTPTYPVFYHQSHKKDADCSETAITVHLTHYYAPNMYH